MTNPPNKIQILDTDTINQIAAGEVIENPAGIVRELLDNAIDSGAKRIEIRVNFSNFFIEILDDGCGIHADDVALAFEKHTTSKITHFEDIYLTPTLGFRGEALASLASVSEITMETATDNSGEGVRYQIRGKNKGKVESIACNPGTRVVVKDLFFNTPVRKKFLALKNSENLENPKKANGNMVLKLKPGEKKNIKQEIIRHVLANDGISFQYFILDRGSEKLEINVPLHYTLKDKILIFFKSNTHGEPLEKALLPVRNNINHFSIEGYITDLSIREYRSDKQFLIIKRRVVRDPGFLKAVLTGYMHKIPRGSHPMIFLRVETERNDIVDANVHPRKEQVKFQNSRLFFDAILNTIKKTLKLNFTTSSKNPIHYDISQYDPGTSSSQLTLAEDLSEARESLSNLKHPFSISDEERESQRQRIFSEQSMSYSSKSREAIDAPPLSVLGQIADTFIIFSIGEDLYITDQHAAHERINYDQLLEKIHHPQNRVDTQMLLIPILLGKDPVEKESILLQREILKQLGFEVEDFGENTLRISRVPAYLPEKKIEKVVKAVMEMISLRSSDEPIKIDSVEAQEFLGEMVATLACRMSIKAGDRLSPTAMEGLIREIYDKGYILTCPHGRPFVKKISLKEMHLFFDRGRHILGDID